jgi:hypothetical protein
MTKNQSYQDRAKAQSGGGPQDERIQKVFREHQERLLAISKENLTLAQKSLDYKQKLIEKVQALAQAEGTSVEKRKQAQEVLNKLKEQELATARKIVEEQDIQAKAGGGAAGGAPSSPESGPGAFKSLMSSMTRQGMMAIVSAAAGVAKVVGDSYRFEQEKASTVAGINQGLYRGSGVEDIMSGRGFDFATTAGERGRARANALEAQKGMNAREAAGTGGGLLAGAVGGFFAGGPIGAIAGGAIGAAGGSAMSGGQLVGGAKSFLQGEGFSTGVERARLKEFAADQESNRQAEIAKDPLKHRAREFYDQNAQRLLQLQQMSGLNTNQMMGTPFSTSMNNQGQFSFNEAQSGILGAAGGMYTTEQKLAAMQGIAGAGGSSAQMAQGQTALNLQRNYGIQSAPELIGMLSGKMTGGAALGAQNEVTKKMLADAFSIGIDTSTMGIETERFLKASTHFVMESGARTEAGMAAVSGEMGKFVTDSSVAGITAATSAREQFERVSGEGASTYSQALGLTKLRSSFKKLGENDISMLNDLTPDEIKAGDSPQLLAAAEKEGITVPELQEKLLGAQKFKFTHSAKQEELRTRATEARKKYEEAPLMQKGAFKKEMDVAMFDLESSLKAGGQAGGLKGLELSSFSKGLTDYGAPKAKGEAPAREMGIFDMKQMAEAAADQTAIRDIKTYEAEFSDNVKNIAKITKEIETELGNLRDTIKKGNETDGTGLNMIKSMMSGKFEWNTKPSDK